MRQDQLEYMYRLRQQDIAPVDAMRSKPVFLIGCGGIGSNFCLLGAKLGLDITAYDGDIVAPENVNAQLFGPSHVGRPKAEVMAELCEQLAGAAIKTVNGYAQEGASVAGIVVEAVDSMQARSAIWQHVILPRARLVDTFISMRMGAESGTVIAVRPHRGADHIWYESQALFADERAMLLPCTGRATSYCASIIGALAVRTVKRLLLDQPIERQVDFELGGLMLVVDG
jgi:hypothetical protein